MEQNVPSVPERHQIQRNWCIGGLLKGMYSEKLKLRRSFVVISLQVKHKE